ncbi:hypothetical protein BDY19DRAFT_887882 [Irpex rosettiformis]|uniref:Uncharacterized protein n=1 Tax=Irpex rosettiformis TaxID=378272 RepID=A0ACB8U7N1_9APHY|nr:hypothetical protein BDY19DRAFT_887882 [Irpex rosettiformis]
MDSTVSALIFLSVICFLFIIWLWMIVSKPAIIFHTAQVFFNFLAMCCFASVASFQAQHKVGPSGLSGFAIFISVLGIFYSLFVLLVPVIYEKYDKGARLARALKEPRVAFILSGAGTAISLLISFITTISAWTEPGCKDASKDPHAKEGGDSFVKGLPGWCSTKKAGAVFFWLAFVFWVGSFVLVFLDFRNGKASRARDPPFTHPEDPTDLDDEESMLEHPASRKSTYDAPGDSDSPFDDHNRYPAAESTTTFSSAPQLPRPSFDAYGAFSDPAPSGFAATPTTENTRVSRTMQYADPYAAVRNAVVTGATTTPPPNPPSYSYGNSGYS